MEVPPEVVPAREQRDGRHLDWAGIAHRASALSFKETDVETIAVFYNIDTQFMVCNK